MASSKHYFDYVSVPAAVMGLFRMQPQVVVNRPPEDRPNIPTNPPQFGDRIWVDEGMRRFLQCVQPLLPMPMMLHYRGYGTQVGTVIITLNSLYWTNDYELFPRLDFKHPEAMKTVNGCPNFWGSFILAMVPLNQYSDFGAEDPDGLEFVRLYEQMHKAGNIREVEVTPPQEREEPKAAETKPQPRRIVRMIDEIDWSQINPQHPVCEPRVEVPTIGVRRKGEGYTLCPPDQRDQEYVAVQWYGDNDGGELTSRNLQFPFPIFARVDDPHWFGHPEWYRTVMIGPLRDWPNKGALAKLIEGGKDPDTVYLYALTSQIGLDDGKGASRPSGVLVEMPLLADSCFGIIRPRLYSNWAVVDEEIAKLRKPRQV